MALQPTNRTFPRIASGSRRRVGIAAIVIAASLGAGFAAVPDGAGATTTADPTITLVQNIKATTHVKKLNQDVVIPQGTFTATIDLANGKLTGHIKLPTATTTINIAGVGVATAKFKVVETKPVVGTVNFTTLRVRATATFYIKIPSAYVGIIPINVVGNSCRSSVPVSVTMTGTANLAGTSTFSGTYTIPQLQNCGLATAGLNLVIPGPGNTFMATTTPRA